MPFFVGGGGGGGWRGIIYSAINFIEILVYFTSDKNRGNSLQNILLTNKMFQPQLFYFAAQFAHYFVISEQKLSA